jgi:hypothetical protein
MDFLSRFFHLPHYQVFLSATGLHLVNLGDECTHHLVSFPGDAQKV